MKLYYSPGACSLGIHILLEEIGRPYETEKVDLRIPRNERPLAKINPKSRVPTLLREDGSVLTEFPAIAYWLARTNPQAGLFPDDVEGQVRVLEATEYCVSTLHMEGFSRLFAARHAATPAEREWLTTAGHAITARALAHIDSMLAGKEWLAGAYSFADSALFYCSSWAANFGLELPANVAAHFARMKARPAVQAALRQEGLA